MDRLVIRLFLCVVAVTGVFTRVAHATQAAVKNLAHDATAHEIWAYRDREKWRKKVSTKRLGKTATLIKVRNQ